MDVCERVTKTKPSIIRISPKSETLNNIFTIYGENLVNTLVTGLSIEVYKNNKLMATLEYPMVTTEKDGTSLKFRFPGSLIENLDPGKYQIRVANSYGESNTVDLNIKSSVLLLSPNGGEQWTFGEDNKVKWNSSPDVNEVSIYLEFPNGGACKIATVPADRRTHTINISENWQCPNISSKVKAGKYKILLLHDRGGYFDGDESDKYFSITGDSWEIYKNEKYGFKFKIPAFFVENGYKIVSEKIRQYSWLAQDPRLADIAFKIKPLKNPKDWYWAMINFTIYSQEYCKNKGKEICNEIRTGIPRIEGDVVYSRFLIENEDYFIFSRRGPETENNWYGFGWSTDVVEENFEKMLSSFKFLE